jgi:hypothetical protein
MLASTPRTAARTLASRPVCRTSRPRSSRPPAPARPATGRDNEPSRVRVLLTGETQDRPVSWQDVADQTGLSRSRAYALLREERARLAAGNGHQPTLDLAHKTP